MTRTNVFDLGGRVAAVIGGTGVLGGAICHGLGEAGAAIAVLGRSEERAAIRVAALEAAGVRATAVLVDATDPAAVEAACREIEIHARPGRRARQRAGGQQLHALLRDRPR